MTGTVYVVLFVAVFGFVAAGFLSALHRIVSPGEEADGAGTLKFGGAFETTWSIVVCTFAGPYLIVSNGIRFWQLDILATPVLFLCAGISLIWSFCSGVLLMEILIAFGIVVV